MLLLFTSLVPAAALEWSKALSLQDVLAALQADVAEALKTQDIYTKRDANPLSTTPLRRSHQRGRRGPIGLDVFESGPVGSCTSKTATRRRDW